jgi:hypothetical protein
VKHITIGRLALALLTTGVICLSLAPVAAAGGGNSANASNSADAKLCQKDAWQNLYNSSTGLAFSSEGACVSDGARDGAYSSLKLTPSVVLENGVLRQSVINLSGFGLQPGSTVTITAGTRFGEQQIRETVASDGTPPDPQLRTDCGNGLFASATGTTSAGATIATPTVTSLCG